MNPFDGSNKETQAQERACERAQGGQALSKYLWQGDKHVVITAMT